MAANSTHHSQTAVVAQDGEKMELRRGPWTVEEDLILINYVAKHGEGRWKSVARCSGLTRTGNSCRLRWLNYLRPEVRRGNITPEEQLLILELHSRWGNRWSKIAQHLPGRTDNEIKNYWRTRVQRHAKLLKCDVNSQQFKDVISGLWVPRLMDRVHTSSAGSAAAASNPCVAPWAPTAELLLPPPPVFAHLKHCPDISSIAGSWSELTSAVTRLSSPSASDVMDYPIIEGGIINVQVYGDEISTGEAVGGASGRSESLLSPYVCLSQGFPEFEQNGWGAAGEFSSESLWTEDDLLFLHQQL